MKPRGARARPKCYLEVVLVKVSLASSQIKKLALCFGGETGKRGDLKSRSLHRDT